MTAIFKREFKAYFTSAIGYVVLAVFLCITGWVFTSGVYSRGVADLTSIFSIIYLLIIFIIPLLTMRTFSEDKRQKTDQLLFTAPVNIISIVIGKFLAAFCVFGIGIFMTLIYQLILSAYISPDWMLYISNVIGLCFLSAMIISLGLCVSAFTESQVVAAVFSIVITLIVSLSDTLLGLVADSTGISVIGTIGKAISPNSRYTQFSVGIFDLPSFVYFISFTAFFLFLAARVLERRRYA